MKPIVNGPGKLLMRFNWRMAQKVIEYLVNKCLSGFKFRKQQ